MKLSKYIMKLLLIMAGSITVLFLLLLLAWCIPDQWVIEKQQESLSLFDEQGDVSEYPFVRERRGWIWTFSHARGAQLDNGTDYTMILNVISDSPNASVAYKAMDCNDYARYWHGYLIFLRPMMLLFSYMQIRYIYMFIYILCGTMVMLRLYRNFGSRMTYLWAVALCFVNPVVLPFSLQFSSVFFLMMAGLLVINRIYRGYDLQRMGILFLLLGILTSYFDFLTAPLLTLGIPMIYLMLLHLYQYGEDSAHKNLMTLFTSSVTWGAGYFVCWGMKWIIASPILGRNVISEGISSMVYRTVSTYHSSMGYDTGRFRAIAMNLFAILPPGITGSDWSWFCVVVLVIGLVLAGIFIRFHVAKKKLLSCIPFLLVAVYPFAWFVLLSQHTSIHFFFTYRILLMTLLGFFIAYGKAIGVLGPEVKEKERTFHE